MDNREARKLQSHRVRRISAACVRCQRRKIKCDGNSPCSSCTRAGKECALSSKQQAANAEVHISSLQDRIHFLERALAEKSSAANVTEPHVGDQTQEGNRSFITQCSNGNAHSELPKLKDENQRRSCREHEIGLISVTGGQDQRYVGPSSGFSFAKLVLDDIGRRDHQQSGQWVSERSSSLPKEVFQSPPATLPGTLQQAFELSAAYWECVHWQYPFLHRPTHLKLLRSLYQSSGLSPAGSANTRPSVKFQVNMVLAISATILSRRLKTPLLAEGYCATAMSVFGQIAIEGSLEGLQCLLLLQIYASHNPSLGLNSWYLNYQCIATVLDLGLQRNVTASARISPFTREMRTRIFWVDYTLDRNLATIMGRPIGLRDEACDLRLPQNIEDESLSEAVQHESVLSAGPMTMDTSIHLFKLARIKSEIKYVANSIASDVPAYSYPRIPDIQKWQDDVFSRLRQWEIEIPNKHNTMSVKTSLIQYHELLMLLF